MFDFLHTRVAGWSRSYNLSEATLANRHPRLPWVPVGIPHTTGVDTKLPPKKETRNWGLFTTVGAQENQKATWLFQKEIPQVPHFNGSTDHLGLSRLKLWIVIWGWTLEWWVSPTTIGFPTKSDHFEVFWGYHHFRKLPYSHQLHHRTVLFLGLKKVCHFSEGFFCQDRESFRFETITPEQPGACFSLLTWVQWFNPSQKVLQNSLKDFISNSRTWSFASRDCTLPVGSHGIFRHALTVPRYAKLQVHRKFHPNLWHRIVSIQQDSCKFPWSRNEVVPQNWMLYNGMDDLGVPLFSETSTCIKSTCLAFGKFSSIFLCFAWSHSGQVSALTRSLALLLVFLRKTSPPKENFFDFSWNFMKPNGCFQK